MKPEIIIIQTEHFRPGKEKPVQNEAAVQITRGSETLIDKIVFKDPIKKISYSQLFDLFQQVQNIAEDNREENQQSNVLTVGNPGAVLMSKNSVSKFDSFVRNMFEKVKGSMTEKEKDSAQRALSIVDELLSKK